MNQLKAVINALRSKPPTGSGMVDKAAKDMQAVPGYRAYSIEMQSQGKAPVSMAEFMKGQR